jgi:hypothetical protein
LLTVPGLSPSFLAISAFVKPAAMQSMMRRSATVSPVMFLLIAEFAIFTSEKILLIHGNAIRRPGSG